MKIFHTGDWHIGNYNGPEANGENLRFLDLCKCLDELVKQAVEEEPDFIIVSGDVFHQARVWSDRGLRESQTVIHYIRVLEKVAPVIIVRGTPNHDSEAQYKSLMTAFDGDDSVHIFMEPGARKVYGYHHGTAITVAALPGFDRGYFRAKHPDLDKEEETAVFTQALADIIIGLKAQCESDIPSVLVGHYTITGANTESGQTAMFAQYEPVVDPCTLAAADFDLTCFGHIHRPQKLEGCNNAFYCGAISQLNFNDEGQKRGYYIHSIHEVPVHTPGEDVPISAYGRVFRELPTREFKTIRLQDKDIAAINEGDDLSWAESDVKDRIVRVLYNCTDEHNKALNKTMMEQRLYELGAFWVQEITPETISITVSKESLDGDTGPEDNLKAYLEERGVPEAEAGRIIERARPIIAEAAEANMTAHTSGTFVPVEVSVKNYRNYREETFNFENVRFCTINGANGAGKSSLFMDAMCDALFEETRERDIGGWISNSPEARSGIIKFTFRLGEATYRVTRTRMKSGKATLNLAELVDGEWTDRSKEKMRDTQAEIMNVIGMDSLTLKATALIMQDQYGLFLTADKEARMTILGNILGLGAYGDMETAAANRLTDVNRGIRNTQEKAADIAAATPDEKMLAESITTREGTIKAMSAEIADTREKADGMKLALSTMEEAAERVAKLTNRISSASAKKSTIETQITAQKGIVWSSEQVLEKRADIEAAAAEYRGLLEKEKALLAAKGEYDSLMKQLDGNKSSRLVVQQNIKELERKKSALALTKIVPLQQQLADEESLAEAHALYAEAKEMYEAIRSRGEEWREAQAKAADADKAVKLARTQGLSKVGAAEAELNHLKQRARLLEKNTCPHAETVRCSFLKDAVEAKEAIPEAEAAWNEAKKEARADLDEAQAALDAALAAIPKDYSPEAETAARGALAALEEDEHLYSGLAVARAELAAAKERAADFEASITEAKSRAAELDGTIMEQEARREGMNAQMVEFTRVQQKLRELEPYLAKERELPVAEEKKTTALARIAELEADVEAITAELAEMNDEREAEKVKTIGCEELLAQYNSIMQAVTDGEKRVQAENMALGAVRENLERAKENRRRIDELMKQAEAMSEEAADLEVLKQAFSQDGIPHNIVRSVIPIFEATATNILGQMSGGHMSVEFVMEKTLKSNSKKEVTALDIVINDSITGRLPYMSRSGGERVKAALAVILAIAELKNSKMSVQPGFLMIDEAPFLDQEGTQAYIDALETIQRRYSHLIVMAITHDMEFKARFPQSITVYKDEAGSHVRID